MARSSEQIEGVRRVVCTRRLERSPPVAARTNVDGSREVTPLHDVSGGSRSRQPDRAACHDITFVGSANDYSVPTVDGMPFRANHEGHGGYTINDEPSHDTKGISPLVATRMKNLDVLIVLVRITPTGSDGTKQAVQKHDDNLHLNQAGYDLVGATWYSAVAPVLR